MTTATLGHYNVLYKNDRRTVRGDLEDLLVRHGVSLLDLNEAREDSPQGKAVLDFAKAHHWETAWTPGDVSLAWDPTVWRADDFGGWKRLTLGAPQRGLPFTHNPTRHLLWQGFTHRDGTRHLVYGGHHTAGYAKRDGEFPPGLEAYKREAGQECVLATNAIQANHFRRHPEYQFHHFLADMNAPQGRTWEWWFPAVVMDGLWEPDTIPGAIDWMVHSRAATANGLKVRKRWTDRKGMASDHAAHLKRVSWPRP